jgi:hypothetical protein
MQSCGKHSTRLASSPEKPAKVEQVWVFVRETKKQFHSEMDL